MLTLQHRDALAWVLRLGIVALAVATAYIHYLLGGTLFLLNAAGYIFFAALMVLPLAFAARCRWLIRGALLGFTLATIGAWVIFGARFSLAYLDKGIELGLVALLFLEMFRYDGGPLAVARRAWHLVRLIRSPSVSGH